MMRLMYSLVNSSEVSLPGAVSAWSWAAVAALCPVGTSGESLFRVAANDATRNSDSPDVPTGHNAATAAQLQADTAPGKLTSEELTKEYIKRIIALDQNGPGVNSVIELNPDALDMARFADVLRKHGIVLGPLHGIPVLLKGNVDTGDKMQTTAGSFALLGNPA